MDTIRAGKQLIELVGVCHHAGLPVLVEGAHGIGKSELIEQAAKALNVGYVCRDLSLMEVTDLVGLPRFEDDRTVYAPPRFLPTEGQGLLVFEELNRCDRAMRAPCLQLLTARCLNEYLLPPGWTCVALINPITGGYDVDELDPALLSRFVHVQLQADHREWLKWARDNDIHTDVIKYVERQPKAFENPETSPRAWTRVSTILKTGERIKAGEQTIRACVMGVVGNTAAVAFLKWRESPESPLDADAILKRYDKTRDTVKGWVADGRLDLVEGSVHQLKLYLQPQNNFDEVKAVTSQWKKMDRFCGDLPGDLQLQLKDWLIERKYELPPILKA